MTTFSGTSGDDTFTAVAGNDTYQLGNGNDTIYFNATVNAPLVVNQPGVLNWTNGFDTVISTDGGIGYPNYDNIRLNFSGDYLFVRKVGANMELSVYAHALSGGTDPGTTDQVGKITLKNAFTASVADRISLISGTHFSLEVYGAPAADSYGHTEIYKIHRNLDSGTIDYTDNYTDINFQTTKLRTKFKDGSTLIKTFDSNANQPWSHIDNTYNNYSSLTPTLLRSEYYADDGSMRVSAYGTDGNDLINGSSGNDMLSGSLGNDTLVGGAGKDALNGGAGSDTLTGGAGNDTLDGGVALDNLQGYDRVDYTSSTSGVMVVLKGTLDGSASDGLGGTDVLRHIEGVRGSAFNDSLTGSAAAFESFEGREGNDTINGGGGVDRADYQNSKAGVTVNLATGLASDGYGSIDTLSNIENVRGSIGFADTITGSAVSNYLEGLGGNDKLSGGAGNDSLIGGLGTDRLTGGTGADYFVFNAPAETGLTSATMDTIADFSASQSDKINLLGMDANAVLAGNQAFVFLGAVSAFTGNATGQLRFDAVSHILYGSTDADTAAEFAIVVTGVTSLAAANFVL